MSVERNPIPYSPSPIPDLWQLLLRPFRRPVLSPELLHHRQLLARWQRPAPRWPLAFLLRLVNHRRHLAAIAAAERSARTASRLAARKQRRQTARATGSAWRPSALPSRRRLFRRRCRQAVRPWTARCRRLLLPLAVRLACHLLSLVLASVRAVLWCCGVGACSNGRRGSALSYDGIGDYQRAIKILTETDRMTRGIVLPL